MCSKTLLLFKPANRNVSRLVAAGGVTTIPPHRAFVALRRVPCYAAGDSAVGAGHPASMASNFVRNFIGLWRRFRAARLSRRKVSEVSASSAQNAGVAGRYAAALFDLAQDAGALDLVERELKSFAALIDGSAELRGFLKSPAYDNEDQLNAIGALAKKAGYSELTVNFLKLVAKNRRLFALEDIIRAFVALAADARGEISAEAVAAAALTNDQIKALRREIESMVGKAVNLETRVDPDLLGGLVVKIGSQMIDASLKTKLNRLKTVMKEAS